MPRIGAIAGFGRVAEQAHVPAFLSRPEFSITAVSDIRPERLSAARALLPKARLYACLDALLDAEGAHLDFVDIATPPFLHGRLVLQALEADCHVLCEKPLTLDPEELSQIQAAASRRDRSVFTIHNWAYAPQWTKIFNAARSGQIGDIRHVELHALRSRPAGEEKDWRTNRELACGGVLVDHGWHNLYLLRRLLAGARPLKMSARLHRQALDQVEDEATLFLEFPAATALLHLSWRAAHRSNGGIILGSRATLELQDNRIQITEAGRSTVWDFPEKLSFASAHPQWFAATLADFSATLASPSLQANNWAEASFCLRTIASAYERASPAPALR